MLLSGGAPLLVENQSIFASAMTLVVLHTKLELSSSVFGLTSVNSTPDALDCISGKGNFSRII